MSLSTFLVLIALTFGQIAMLTVTLFVLWLAEEFGGSHEEERLDAPGPRPEFTPM